MRALPGRRCASLLPLVEAKIAVMNARRIGTFGEVVACSTGRFLTHTCLDWPTFLSDAERFLVCIHSLSRGAAFYLFRKVYFFRKYLECFYHFPNVWGVC